ncbi:uncharacterized protein [Lepeophtheirus salmonis]|uniref:uncharacterized protein n=1 Tax=Lepeophtheirus salmonis TaxID=72036 RepID=UPI001AEA3E9A|nr:uncharacterized protein LOC121128318 [Lepeophtheirus salmonis]
MKIFFFCTLFLSSYFQCMPLVKATCRGEKDCLKTYSCSFSLFSSSKCIPPRQRNVFCGKNRNGQTVPDHEICIQDQVKDDNLKGPGLAVNRCYKTKGSFKCQNAYLNYCVTDYTMKQPIKNICPPNFNCVNREFKNGKAKVCIPSKIFQRFGKCSNDFDCGYSTLLNNWALCLGSKCDGPIQ